ncbi:MAG TPA: pyridoxamine 5'-phosphate oxidase family protein [Candidatus Bathyarchaeia archaeon]|nr:pyridoxamine 5'-phosphate oxidase family protein [Candidatus Bathyarchaeia archaeon]
MGKEEMRRELDFREKKEELIRFLESKDSETMVLATSHNDRVLARNVLVATDGLDLYFFTWRRSRKCMQIQKNPKVAFCKDKVQMEGVAEILGGLLDGKTKKYTDMMRRRFPEAVEEWERRPGMVIVRVKPTFAVTGGSSNDDVYIDYLDLKNEKAYSKKWAHF